MVAAAEEMLDADTEEIMGEVVSFATVTLIPTAVAVFPAASRATADKICVPLVATVAFQETEYGATGSFAPRLTPSRENCTPATPTLSEAEAETVTAVPETVAPFAGAVSETVGGVTSARALLTSLEKPLSARLRL